MSFDERDIEEEGVSSRVVKKDGASAEGERALEEGVEVKLYMGKKLKKKWNENIVRDEEEDGGEKILKLRKLNRMRFT